MTTYYVTSNTTGNAADPVTGVAKVCGPDTASTGPVGSDTNDGLSAATPILTLAQLPFCTPAPTSGDTINIAGRHYMDVNLAGTGNGAIDFVEASNITIQQWSGQDPAMITPGILVGKTGGWSSPGAGQIVKTTTTNLVILHATYDYEWATNMDSLGRRKAFCRGPTAKGVNPRGTWTQPTVYAVGDSVRDTTANITYICITAHTSGGALPISTNADAAKWESYATQKTAALAAAGTTVSKWAYDHFSGEISFGLASTQTGTVAANNLTSNANGPMVIPRNNRGIVFHGNTTAENLNSGNVIDGINFFAFCDAISTSPGGCAIVMASAGSCTTKNCRHWDAGLHAESWGSGCSNNTSQDNVVVGMGNAGSNGFVFNATGTTAGSPNQTRGDRCVRNIVYANSLLDHSGLPWLRGSAVGGFYAHGSSGAGNYVTDVEWLNCQVIEYIPASGSPDAVVQFLGNDMQAPSDLNNPETYPLRIRQTDPSIKTLTNGTYTADQSITFYIAYINCRIDKTKLNSLSNGYCYETQSVTGGYFFDGCEGVASFQNGNGATNVAWFNVGTAATIRRRNCSLYDNRSGSHAVNKTYSIDYFNAAPNGTTGLGVIANGDIYGYRDVTTTPASATHFYRIVAGDTGINAQYLDYNNCLYFNTGADEVADDSSRDADAEWIATVDAGAVNNAAVNPFSDTTGASLDLTGAAQALIFQSTVHPTFDILRRPYGTAHNYGAFNYVGVGGNGFWEFMMRQRLARLRRRRKRELAETP